MKLYEYKSVKYKMSNELHITVIGCIYFVVLVFGICGNGLELFLLLRSCQIWKASYFYLTNLAVADLLFASCLSFKGYTEFNHMTWIFGPLMCRFYWALRFINMYASIFFLTAMSHDRWTAVARAAKLRNRQRIGKGCAILLAAGIWITSLIFSMSYFMFYALIPNAFFRNNISISSTANNQDLNLTNASFVANNDSILYSEASVPKICVISYPIEYSTSILLLFQTLIGFILPFAIISYSYIRILYTVKHKVIHRARPIQRQINKLAAIVITAFFVCWAPYHALNLCYIFTETNIWDIRNSFYPVFICLTYANSCINPVIYVLTSRNLKKYFSTVFWRKKQNNQCRLTVKKGTKVKRRYKK